MSTAISPPVLASIRAEAHDRPRDRFVDPTACAAATRVIRARGERWLAAVLGRDVSRRSLGVPGMPWLEEWELYALLHADQAEDRARFEQITSEENR